MNTYEIDDFVDTFGPKELKKCYHGTFPSSHLPEPRLLPFSIIFNNQTSDLDGQHWMAIWIDIARRGYVFDSFGRIPQYRIQKFMNKHCIRWSYNNKQVQRLTSNSCGLFCLHYIFNRLLQLQPEKYFTVDFDDNERILEKWISSLIRGTFS